MVHYTIASGRVHMRLTWNHGWMVCPPGGYNEPKAIFRAVTIPSKLSRLAYEGLKHMSSSCRSCRKVGNDPILSPSPDRSKGTGRCRAVADS